MRLCGLKQLYHAVTTGNESMMRFTQSEMHLIEKLNAIDLKKGACELYSFRSLISMTEVAYLMQLNQDQNVGVDFKAATDDDIKGLL